MRRKGLNERLNRSAWPWLWRSRHRRFRRRAQPGGAQESSFAASAAGRPRPRRRGDRRPSPPGRRRCRRSVRRRTSMPSPRPMWALRGALFASSATIKPIVRPASGPFAVAPTTTTSAADLAAVKQVIELARKGKDAEANATENSIVDPVARKLVEWVILRSDNTKPSFDATPPSSPPIRAGRMRRCSAAAPRTRCGTTSSTTRPCCAFFADETPITAKGRFVLARALLAQGDRAGAEALVREAWRNDDCSRRRREQGARDLRRHAHARRPQGCAWITASMPTTPRRRCAPRSALGGTDLAIAHAWARGDQQGRQRQGAARRGAGAPRGTTPATSSRASSGCARATRPRKPRKLMLAAPRDPDELVDLDQWWLERRLLVRKLLDDRDAQTAYRIARDAPPPVRGNYPRRPALHRRLDRAALPARSGDRGRPFRADRGRHGNPIALARAGYWQGRAAEALGQHAQAHAFYERRPRIRPPITASSRARASACPISACAARPLHAGRARGAEQARSRARGGNSLRARRARSGRRRSLPTSASAATDVAGTRGARRSRRAARRRPRHAAARQGRARPRPAARLLRLSRPSACPTTSRSARRSSRRSPIRSRARKATSTRRSSRAPRRWA